MTGPYIEIITTCSRNLSKSIKTCQLELCQLHWQKLPSDCDFLIPLWIIQSSLKCDYKYQNVSKIQIVSDFQNANKLLYLKMRDFDPKLGIKMCFSKILTIESLTTSRVLSSVQNLWKFKLFFKHSIFVKHGGGGDGWNFILPGEVEGLHGVS